MICATHHSRGEPALRYTVGGTGPALLVLHGVTRCGRDWEPLVPVLAADWSVVALDQRGHGGSSRASSYLVTDYVADAVRVVRDEVAAPVVILGHSLGAMVAAAVAAELPQLVRAVVLEDPPFQTMGSRIAGSAWQAQFIGMRQAARNGGSSDEIAGVLADIRLPVGGGFRRLGDMRDCASLAWSAECLAQLDPEVLTPVIEGRWLDGYAVAGVFSRIRCPTLLLQADPAAGGALDDADAVLVGAALPSCRRIRFPGIGHLLHRDRPDAVLDAVREFAALHFAARVPPASTSLRA